MDFCLITWTYASFFHQEGLQNLQSPAFLASESSENASIDDTSSERSLIPASQSVLTARDIQNAEIMYLTTDGQPTEQPARDDAPPAKKSRIQGNSETCLTNFDLRQILSKSVTGQAILASYHPSNGLSSKCQGYLTTIIICHFFDADIK